MQPFTKIIDKKDDKNLKKLETFLISKIKKKYSAFKCDLNNLHKIVPVKNVNDLRLYLYDQINTHCDWEEILIGLTDKELSYSLGKDILVQSKINVSIQMPNDKSSLLPMHSDCASADTPFQNNIWIPLTDAYKTNSMFILSESDTRKYVKNIVNRSKTTKDLKVSAKDFVELKKGEILIFNPSILHGNVVNKTKHTRISLNIRVKSLFSPEPDSRNSDRRFGSYYKILKISDETKFALSMIDSGYFE